MFRRKPKDHFTNGFGSLLKLHRERTGMTQDRLGEMVHPARSKSNISQIERGRNKLRTLQLNEICELALAVRVSPYILMTAFLIENFSKMSLAGYSNEREHLETLAKTLCYWAIDPFTVRDLVSGKRSPGIEDEDDEGE